MPNGTFDIAWTHHYDLARPHTRKSLQLYHGGDLRWHERQHGIHDGIHHRLHRLGLASIGTPIPKSGHGSQIRVDICSEPFGLNGVELPFSS